MKKLLSALLISLFTTACFAQHQPVSDTLIPKQHKRDTVVTEPKLDGGALIDTVTPRENKFRHRPVHPVDSLRKPK